MTAVTYVTVTCANSRCVDPKAGPMHRLHLHPDLDVDDALARAGFTRDGLNGPVYCRRHTPTLPAQRTGDHDDD